ncbi:MAG TPA: hypothetical protein VFZ38_10750 [Vicinamibacterales bacterium]
MPTVPQYQPQVAPQALPSARQQVRVDADAFGGGIADALGDAANSIGRFAYEEKSRADAAAVMEADQALFEVENQLFHNPETGVFAKKGKDAIGAGNKVLPDWDKRAGEIEGKLRNPDQKAAFTRLRMNRRQDLERGSARHSLAESERYYKELGTAYTATASQAAVANFTDPKRVEDEVQKARSAMLLGSDGMSPEALKVAQDEAEAAVRVAVIGRIAEDDPLKANDEFLKIRDRLPADTAARVQAGLDTAVSGEKGRIEAEGIIKKFGGSKSGALSAVNDIEDPKIRTAAKSAVTAHFQEVTAAQAEAKQAAEDAGWRAALTVPFAQMDSATVAALYRNSPATIPKIIEFQERGGKVDKVTTAQNFGRYKMMAPDELAKVDPNQLIVDLGPGTPEYKSVLEDVQKARNPTAGGAGFTRDQVKEQFDTAAGNYPAFKPNSKGKRTEAQDAALGEVWQTIDRNLELARQGGKAVAYDERQKIIDSALMDYWRKNTVVDATPGAFTMGTDKAVGALTLDDVREAGARIPADTIPKVQLDKARSNLAALGVKDSDKNAAMYYSAFVAAGGGAKGKQAADDFMRGWARGD